MITLNNHISNVEQWLNLAFEENRIPDMFYVLAFASTLDEELKGHLTNNNFNNIKTKEQLLDKISKVMQR